MPEYLTPGVYVEEFEIGAKPIEGVSTSTAGFLGETERGPTYPQLVTSFPEYRRMFGDFFAETKYMPVAVDGFFANGGKRCYIARIVDRDAAVAASADLGSVLITAVGEGAWGNGVAFRIKPASTERTIPRSTTETTGISGSATSASTARMPSKSSRRKPGPMNSNFPE